MSKSFDALSSSVNHIQYRGHNLNSQPLNNSNQTVYMYDSIMHGFLVRIFRRYSLNYTPLISKATNQRNYIAGTQKSSYSRSLRF